MRCNFYCMWLFLVPSRLCKWDPFTQELLSCTVLLLGPESTERISRVTSCWSCFQTVCVGLMSFDYMNGTLVQAWTGLSCSLEWEWRCRISGQWRRRSFNKSRYDLKHLVCWNIAWQSLQANYSRIAGTYSSASSLSPTIIFSNCSVRQQSCTVSRVSQVCIDLLCKGSSPTSESMSYPCHPYLRSCLALQSLNQFCLCRQEKRASRSLMKQSVNCPVTSLKNTWTNSTPQRMFCLPRRHQHELPIEELSW